MSDWKYNAMLAVNAHTSYINLDDRDDAPRAVSDLIPPSDVVCTYTFTMSCAVMNVVLTH